MQICQQNMSDSFSITKYKFFLCHIQTFCISALFKSFSIGSSLVIHSLNCRHLCPSNVQVINLKTEILLSFSTSLSPGAEVMLMLYCQERKNPNSDKLLCCICIQKNLHYIYLLPALSSISKALMGRSNT